MEVLIEYLWIYNYFFSFDSLSWYSFIFGRYRLIWIFSHALPVIWDKKQSHSNSQWLGIGRGKICSLFIYKTFRLEQYFTSTFSALLEGSQIRRFEVEKYFFSLYQALTYKIKILFRQCIYYGFTKYSIHDHKKSLLHSFSTWKYFPLINLLERTQIVPSVLGQWEEGLSHSSERKWSFSPIISACQIIWKWKNGYLFRAATK